MRYHHETPEQPTSYYGELYLCNHHVYSRCTLFKIGKKGLAVIQQRFDSSSKHTWWEEIDPGLADQLYLHPRFKPFFDSWAREATSKLYPTVTIRQIMWALKMKPLKRERWETVFDHKDI